MPTSKDEQPKGDGADAVKNTAAAIQKATDEAEEKGFYGDPVDETPREHYTVDGVTSGKPTPENPDDK